jgi:hypothetical protein
MTHQLHRVPFDDANLEAYEDAHIIDHDLETTTRAVSVARDAHRAGHPGDPDAARRTVCGPSGAAAVQATMAAFIQKVLALDPAFAHGVGCWVAELMGWLLGRSWP